MKLNITVNQFTFDHLLSSLQNKIRASGFRFNKVVGIRHGGIHLSRPIASYLGLPHEEVHISKREGATIVSNINYTPTSNQILLVDDIVDDGWTVQKFWQHFNPFAKVASMFWNCESRLRPDFHVETKVPGHWIVFPWERG